MTEKKELIELRDEINAIDRQLTELFRRRMNVSARIGAYKKAHNMPVLDEARETELLNRVSQAAGEDLADEARKLYSTILELSRAYQQKLR